MPRLFRQPYTKPIPAGAEIVTMKGKPHARFKEDGKTVTAPLNRKGHRIRLLSAKWYGEYVDANGQTQREPLSTDKTAAGQMLAELVRKAELGKAGVSDPYAQHRKRPLREHLEDFRAALSAKGNSPDYVALVLGRLRALVEGRNWQTLRDISASQADEWIARQKTPGQPATQ